MDEWQCEIPSLQNAVRLEKIEKGFSTDKKYRVNMSNGEQRLLRVSAIAEWERKRAEYAILEALRPLAVKTSLPIEQGIVREAGICYSVLSYVEGEDARDALPRLTEAEQEQIGRIAGSELAIMHQLSAPAMIPSWYERCIQKHKRYVDAYQTCGVTIKHAEKIMVFVEEHIAYLKGGPIRFLHVDFHVGNLIVHERQYAGVIDFNRFDWGDPVHDFTKLAFFSSEVSLSFSIGQLKSYFQHKKTPESFWTLYSIYVAMAVFSSVVWTMRTVPEQLDAMKERVERIVWEHHGFERLTPEWFFTE